MLATSEDGSTASTAYSIAINDLDEFDVVAQGDSDGAANEVGENASEGTSTGLTVSALDGDATFSGISYAMVDDAGGRFNVDLATGEVTVAANADLDFETISSHTITVRAISEDGSQVDQTYTITVVDRNEAPKQLAKVTKRLQDRHWLLAGREYWAMIAMWMETPWQPSFSLDPPTGRFRSIPMEHLLYARFRVLWHRLVYLRGQ